LTIDLFQQLTQVLQKEQAVLATVIEVKGSVPRKVGAKMIITADGSTFNTIGGGAGEAKVIRQARIILATGEKQGAKQLVEIDLTGVSHRETQGICGGMMQVWLERWSGENAIALAQQICDRLKLGQAVTLVTPLTAEQSPYLLENNSAKNPLSDRANAFVETIAPPPLLLIVGAGHVGEQLAKVADLVGFQIAVQDDRPEWANSQRYHQAVTIANEPIDSVVDSLASHTQLYAALVTRGYQYDLEALAVLLKREIPCQYLGAIGSEKRVRQVYRAMAKIGISQQKLQSIYAPIGLDIGAITPEEIAVSIGAELILARRGGTGLSLRDRLRQIN
jgi:xanthine dehydrogenase accessory factor